jgi:hypothetical protein
VEENEEPVIKAIKRIKKNGRFGTGSLVENLTRMYLLIT